MQHRPPESGSKNSNARKGKGNGRSKVSGRGLVPNSSKGKGSTKDKGAGKSEDQGRSDHTLHFYSIDEVLSALQKAVRRGHARNAAFWAGELHVSGLSKIAVTRLCIMTVEDVGIASPYAPFVANAVQALLLRSEEFFKDWAPESTLDPSLILICGLARWVASLPKTRTSNMLASFQQAKAEERRRSTDAASRRLLPCSVEDVGAALSQLYHTSVGDLSSFLSDPRAHDEAFLQLEEEVFLQAYAYQLCQQKEALACDPLFDVLSRGMVAEEERLRCSVPKVAGTKGMSTEAEHIANAARVADFVSGFVTVRNMVVSLQHLCKDKGLLDTAARMCVAQALLLATRAHHLVSEGIIVVPSLMSTTTSRKSDVGRLCQIAAGDLVTVCGECQRPRFDGLALARHNARILSHYGRVNASRTLNSSVALNYEEFVRDEIFSASTALVPRHIFECLQRPAVDAQARYLHVPPYCIDVHTRRGSGYPMHRDWESRIQPQNPGLEEWDAEEVEKSHGALSAEGRKMASQFSRYGLVVSDEYFPGPSHPSFEIATALRPANWEHFQAAVLPVAALDHGDAFLDRRRFPEGYGQSWDSSVCLSRLDGKEESSLSDWLSSSSETAALLARCSPAPESGSYCSCRQRNFYATSATPQDPYFSAAKTFKSWASQNSFPSRSHFPGGRLPKILESVAFNTINDDPEGKKLSQTEHLRELIDGSVWQSADEKRSAIDSRPSVITEFHRAWMHEVIQKQKSTTGRNVTLNEKGPAPGESLDTQLSIEGNASKEITSAAATTDSEVAKPGTASKQSRWKRK